VLVLEPCLQPLLLLVIFQIGSYAFLVFNVFGTGV
jgi:hypothetical protein